MQLASFLAAPAYSQLVVVDAAYAHGFGPDWTEADVAQGLVWDDGCVAFGLLSDAGLYQVEVEQADADNRPPEAHLRPGAMRAVVVPFTVSAAGRVAVSDLNTDHDVALAAGAYALLFQVGAAGGAGADAPDWWSVFTFLPGAIADGRVLVADTRLRAPPTLRLRGDADRSRR